jgi:palmitoyl-protein thioesterase
MLILSKLLKMFYSSLIILFLTSQMVNTTLDMPIVLLHGVASDAENTQELADWILFTFNRKVFNIELGNGIDTSLTPMLSQLDILCKTIYDIPQLANGFDFIGMSQGGILARGYTEYCNKFKVRNLITLVSPHGGVFYKSPLLNFIKIYSPEMQKKYSFTNYWRNPIDYELYKKNSTYLSELNNEKYVNDINKKNIESLQNFVMVFTPFDVIVIPPQSAIFSLYNSNLDVIPIFDTELYKQDWLGLQKLDKTNRLKLYETNCTHMEHIKSICFSQLYNIFKYYL